MPYAFSERGHFRSRYDGPCHCVAVRARRTCRHPHRRRPGRFGSRGTVHPPTCGHAVRAAGRRSAGKRHGPAEVCGGRIRSSGWGRARRRSHFGTGGHQAPFLRGTGRRRVPVGPDSQQHLRPRHLRTRSVRPASPVDHGALLCARAHHSPRRNRRPSFQSRTARPAIRRLLVRTGHEAGGAQASRAASSSTVSSGPSIRSCSSFSTRAWRTRRRWTMPFPSVWARALP